MRVLIFLSCLQLCAVGCSSPPVAPADGFSYDVTAVDEGADAPSGPTFCSLSGSDVTGATVPTGMCIRRYASVAEPRALTFAPNGDLFVAAPSNATAGGAFGGAGEIHVLSDDDHDGTAEVATFATAIPDVHGIGIGNGYLYFTTTTQVFRTPYMPGQRKETGPRESVGTFEQPYGTRWTHGLAVSVAGAVYATLGVESASTCPDTPRAGLIERLDTGPSMDPVAAGFRNPMYIRCHYRDEVCLAAELGDDGGQSYRAHEKLIMVRPGTNYGFPCCATTAMPSNLNRSNFDCANATREEATFPLNDTPFGLDWERGHWPMPYRDAVFVALHGSFYSNPQWQGARIVFGSTDPSTHAPTGTWYSFVLGFGPDSKSGPLQRPSDIAFAPDGRLFFSDDHGNAVYWVAPDTLRMAQR